MTKYEYYVTVETSGNGAAWESTQVRVVAMGIEDAQEKALDSLIRQTKTLTRHVLRIVRGEPVVGDTDAEARAVFERKYSLLTLSRHCGEYTDPHTWARWNAFMCGWNAAKGDK